MSRETSAALSGTAWWLTTMSTTWPRFVLYTCAAAQAWPHARRDPPSGGRGVPRRAAKRRGLRPRDAPCRAARLAQRVDDLLLGRLARGREALLHRQEVLQQLGGDAARVGLLAVRVRGGHGDQRLGLLRERAALGRLGGLRGAARAPRVRRGGPGRAGAPGRCGAGRARAWMPALMASSSWRAGKRPQAATSSSLSLPAGPTSRSASYSLAMPSSVPASSAGSRVCAARGAPASLAAQRLQAAAGRGRARRGAQAGPATAASAQPVAGLTRTAGAS